MTTRKFLNKFYVLGLALYGEVLKFVLRLLRFPLRERRQVSRAADAGCPEVIVSLTSYAHRVSTVLPYTLYSLLRQDYPHLRVILWLDNENWDDARLPSVLQKMQRYGLEIRYVRDLKSYKKHVPALTEFPDALIVTTDDDFYYSSTMVSRLVEAWRQHPDHIHTLRAHRLTFNADGTLKSYRQWRMLVHDTCEPHLFPTTGGGCMLQRRLLHEDVLREDLFTKLCPKADDVWFYMMGELRHTPVSVLPSRFFGMIPLDLFYELRHKGSSLQHENVALSLNDKQLHDTMAYYGITEKDL